MNSEFNKGAAFARDLIICHIFGMQNKIGNDEFLNNLTKKDIIVFSTLT